jgi:uncharacterized membrane protein
VVADLLRAAAHLFAYPGAQHLQNIHPLIVHFPIALLFAAALIYWLGFLAGRQSWQWSGLWTLVLGAIGAAAAVVSGLYAAPGVMLAPSVKAALLTDHKRIMIAVLILSAALALWAIAARPMPVRGRGVFLAMLVLVAALIAKGADYGGRMVYDYNAGGYACGQPIEFSQ